MKLLSLEVQKFRAIDELRLSLVDALGAPRPITVIAGPNGSGKTSILFAIANALRGVMGYRTPDVPPPTYDDIRSSGSSGRAWTRAKRESQVTVSLQFDQDEQVAIRELLRLLRMEAPPPLDDGCLTVTWTFPPGFAEDGSKLGWWTASIDPPRPFVRSWLNARKLAIRAWSQRVPNVGPEYLRRIGGMMFFPQDRNLRERILPDETAAGSIPSGASPEAGSDEGREFEQPRARERTVTDILHFLSDYAQNRVPPLPDDQNWEKRIQAIFNRVCAPKEYLGYLYRGEDDQVGSPVLKHGEAEYPLAFAASGEQVVLEYITRLTYPSPLEHSLVLIDEPEIHLHPAWIRKLYLALPEIGRTNQYVLTTHSTELRQRAAADNALVDLGILE